MLKIYTAYTTELDDVDGALAEIIARIDLNGLAKNSVGLISCYSEFIDTGIIAALSEKLPFDIIGATTMASSSGRGPHPLGSVEAPDSAGNYGMYSLGLTVLTSDDTCFQTAISAPLTPGGYEESLSTAYHDALGKLPGDPSLIFAFLPLVSDFSTSGVVESLNVLCKGVPIFGTVSGDVTLTQENCYTLRNGQGEKRAAALLLIHGAVNPRFIVSSLPDKNIGRQKAVVTESEGCLVKKVNGVTLLEYLKDMGIVPRISSGIGTVKEPFMVDYGNGSKRVALRAHNILENGDALFSGPMPQGVTFSIGQVDRDGIIGTAQEALHKILEDGDAQGAVIFTCMSRYIMLTPNKDDEMKTIQEYLGGKIPYAHSYSGGEICPVYGEDGKTYNHLHGYSFVACVF
ncbi:FIST C-terminal domain-containing protein [Leadbettera azotonutricia]|uniref:FIST C-domain domain-containing protein n=1 Tax=Leadbettera azotonutricia (strain ATCC BAA-888 / DSM 13862 / ZAS-9) TaxID=545695 RepID=F5YGF4_LEAAZ|nr:FIST C-terminal domain-containing protein [Leadbettera azotonutricia]AEF80135.1 hypothetical protein TREAZ_2363 [Leadbettera azotonutricia ZAS-9]